MISVPLIMVVEQGEKKEDGRLVLKKSLHKTGTVGMDLNLVSTGIAIYVLIFRWL